ncbi:phosphoenolpyruvate--protein phosphotransferase [Pajaroellobacter abortibovis]|uniref:Phosphoenolpyruvate-protein phosphotransferase n=1 Tax=Pajaroellobacter abortibovis TaxID=1882918 RepID=A0A1L6MXG1_9BACT|nr:phosphoenolpyruvate--protein phosphotransferase [Pajaroellobacter abortibovis]APS00125.1 phosphoenolpyruvate--protein phosphotransferase [Pajaroellobacter abortibovis]
MSTSVVIQGSAASPGIAIGSAFVLPEQPSFYHQGRISPEQISLELEKFRKAVQRSETNLNHTIARTLKLNGNQKQLAILETHLLMLQDPFLHQQVEYQIEQQGMTAECAVTTATKQIIELFQDRTSLDPQQTYIMERRNDITSITRLILQELKGCSSFHNSSVHQPVILVARDLSPAEIVSIDLKYILGIITETGTSTSHTSILARSFKIPTIVGVSDALHSIHTGVNLIVDGFDGKVTIHPTLFALQKAITLTLQKMMEQAEKKEMLRPHSSHINSSQGGLTQCQTPICLKANVGFPSEATLALECGAEGIGLYRTEFVYLRQTSEPDEEEQYRVYKSVVDIVSPHPVTFRTFDIGGDKWVGFLPLHLEKNPALGLRAIRLALHHPQLFLNQLRAIVRASAHGEVRILLPFITHLQELHQARQLIQRAQEEIQAQGIPCAPRIPIGMMIEVPSAVMMADVFARETDFFSLGTNDLVQYALASDRNHQGTASSFHPAIIRMIKMVVQASAPHQSSLSLCGSMASNPFGMALLIGLGLREFSIEAKAIPNMKEALHHITISECEESARVILSCETEAQIKRILTDRFGSRFINLFVEDPFFPFTTDPKTL